MFRVLQCIHHIDILRENMIESTSSKGLEKKVTCSNLDITSDKPKLGELKYKRVD